MARLMSGLMGRSSSREERWRGFCSLVGEGEVTTTDERVVEQMGASRGLQKIRYGN